MPKQAAAKLGDLLPDNPSRDNPGLVRAENVIPHKTSYLPVRNIVEESDPLDALCRGAIGLVDYLGVVHNYAGDVTKLYERTGVAWNDISRSVLGGSSGDGYSLPSNHNWEFIRAFNNVVASSGVQPLQEQLGFSGNFEDLIPDAGVPGNTDPTPSLRYIAPVRDFVLGGWTATDTNLIKWSGIGNHRVWTPTVLQSGEQPLQRGGQVTGVVGGEYGVVFCEQSIYRLTYVGAPVVFQIDEVAPGHGTTAPGSIAQYGDTIFFIDTDGFYMFNGAQAIPIGSNKLNDTFLRDYDSEFAQRVISAVDISRSLIWWGYPSQQARTGPDGQKIPDKIIVYDWTTGRFAGPINLEVEELVYSETQASFLLDDVTTTNFPLEATIPGPCFEGGADPTCIDADLFPFDGDAGLFKGGDARLQAFSFNHRQSSFTGAILKASIETGEYALTPGRLSMVTGFRALVDGNDPNITVRIGCRQQTRGAVNWSVELPPNARTGLHNFRKKARYHRFEINVDGDYEHIFGGEAEFEPSGAR
ncbi:MAG: hypothetical protein PVI97_00685 [Candidatus Thiodiazotropha sp.]|jgi:hypothetical protein